VDSFPGSEEFGKVLIHDFDDAPNVARRYPASFLSKPCLA
jgi:hypothetical protein